MRLSSIFCVTVLAAAAGISMNAQAGVIIGEPFHFKLSHDESESLDVAEHGLFLMVTCPVPVPGGDETYVSSIPTIFHRPHAPTPFRELFVTDLGPGEVTDVAMDTFGRFAFAAIREDDANTANQLVVMRGDCVTERLDLPASSDGLGLDPGGRYLVVAVEKGEAIAVYDTGSSGRHVRLAALIGREAMLPFFEGEEDRLAEEALEPESVNFTPNGSLALVTLQEQASVAVIDMRSLAADDRRRRRNGLSPEEIGARALKNMVHLPFGFENTGGEIVGVEPDGISVSPEGDFAVTANEASTSLVVPHSPPSPPVPVSGPVLFCRVPHPAVSGRAESGKRNSVSCK